MSTPVSAQPIAYVVHGSANMLSVINTATNTVTDTIPVGTHPSGVRVTPDGSRAYVANFGTLERPGGVSVIDTATNTITANLAFDRHLSGLAFTPNGLFTWVITYDPLDPFRENGSEISVLQTSTDAPIVKIGHEGVLSPAVFSPDGAFAYVAEVFGGQVLVIDTTTYQVVTTVNVGWRAFGMAISPDARFLYVVDPGPALVSPMDLPGAVQVLDTSSNTVTNSITVGASPGGIVISPNGRRLYVTSDQSLGTVSVIDSTTLTVVDTVELGAVAGIALTPDGRFAYVTLFSANSVAAIDLASDEVIATIPVGARPRGIAISDRAGKPAAASPDHGCSLATVQNAGRVWLSVLFLAAAVVIRRLAGSRHPQPRHRSLRAADGQWGALRSVSRIS